MYSFKLLRGAAGLTASVLICLISSSGATVAAAQQPETLNVSTQLVMVDVVVSDRNGPVDGLGASDFVVLDNGEPQQIAVFEATTEGGDTEDVVQLPAGVTSNRRDWRGAVPTAATVILVDRVNTPLNDQIFMNNLLRNFMASSSDLGRVALYELATELSIVHDYTHNPQELLQKAMELQTDQSLALDNSQAAGFESSLGQGGLDQRINENTGGAELGDQFNRVSSDIALQNRIQRVLETLEVIASHLEGLPGRKNIVWLSGRFPFTFYPRRQTDLNQQVDLSVLNWMEEVGHRLTANNIAVYPVDVRGPNSSTDDAYVADLMTTIAEMTGGRSYYGTNDVGQAIGEAVADTRMVYSIGFYPSKPGDNGSFRTIDVEVPGQPEADVFHRPGYFASATAEGASLPGLEDMLTSPLDAVSVGLVGRAVALPPDSGNPLGSFRLDLVVDLQDLTLAVEGGKHHGSFDLVSVFQPDDGNVIVLPQEVLPVNLTEEAYQNAMATGFIVQKIISTDGQAGEFRVVVRDRATGAGGSLWIPAG